MTNLEKDKIKYIISDKLGADIEDVQDETNLSNDLGMDSLDAIELIMEFEKEFDCQILDDDAADVTIVSDIYALLDKSINK